MSHATQRAICRCLIGAAACSALLATARAQRETVEEMLQRRTVALQSQVAALDAQIEELNRRIPSVEETIERLTKEALEIKVPDPEEEVKEPPKQEPRKVAFRPPFEREVQKKTPIALICQNNRVALLDIDESEASFKLLLKDDTLRQQLIDTKRATLPAGDFQILLTLEIIGSSGYVSQSLVPAPGHDGETESSALRAGSRLMRRLDGLVAERDIIQFAVYPDSFEIFRAVRQELWRREFGIQWAPIPHGEEIGIGSGPITQQ